MNQDQFSLTDEQFSKIEPHLPTDTRGKERVDDLRVISGIDGVAQDSNGLTVVADEADLAKSRRMSLLSRKRQNHTPRPLPRQAAGAKPIRRDNPASA
jgi:hypothetical protein